MALQRSLSVVFLVALSNQNWQTVHNLLFYNYCFYTNSRWTWQGQSIFLGGNAQGRMALNDSQSTAKRRRMTLFLNKPQLAAGEKNPTTCLSDPKGTTLRDEGQNSPSCRKPQNVCAANGSGPILRRFSLAKFTMGTGGVCARRQPPFKARETPQINQTLWRLQVLKDQEWDEVIFLEVPHHHLCTECSGFHHEKCTSRSFCGGKLNEEDQQHVKRAP